MKNEHHDLAPSTEHIVAKSSDTQKAPRSLRQDLDYFVTALNAVLSQTLRSRDARCNEVRTKVARTTSIIIYFVGSCDEQHYAQIVYEHLRRRFTRATR